MSVDRKLLFVCFIVGMAGFSSAAPPYIEPEPQATTDQGGQLFNTIFWQSSGASQYRVRCLLAGPDSGIAFPEPYFTRGGTNVIYFSKPDIIEWTTTNNTNYDFYYPDFIFPFSYLMNGSVIRYQVNSVPDPLDQFSQVTSKQDNVGPYILGQTFQIDNVHAGFTGDASGSVKIVDYESGVLRGMVIPFYGAQQGPEIDMGYIGNDTYTFVIPEPPGGWASLAGDYLTVRVHGYDNAALPSESSPNWWYNETFVNFQELVEALGDSPVPPVMGETGSGTSAKVPEIGDDDERLTNFRIQWSFDPNFGSIEGEQDVLNQPTYGSESVGWLNNGGQYWFRVGHENQFGVFQYGAPTISVSDYDLPYFVPGSWTPDDLNEDSTGPWTGSIGVEDVELEFLGGAGFVQGTFTFRIGVGELQTVNLQVYGDPPGSPASFYFSVPEPPGGWASYGGQTVNSMVVKVWDSAAPPDGFGPNIPDNTSYFYPEDEDIEAVRPTIALLTPVPSQILEDEAWIKWNATDDQVPGGTDPDGDETEDLTILLHYKDRFTPWTLIGQYDNSASQPDSVLWDLTGVSESATYTLRAIARDPESHADTASVEPVIVNVPDTPQITVLEPNGGEVILGEFILEWNATDADSLYGQPPASIRIDAEYSPDAGASWFDISMNSHLNDGEELWNTTGLSDGSNYLVKLRATDPTDLWSEDESDGVFTIDNNDAPDSVLLISPNGNEMLYGTHTIRWYAHDPDVIDTLRIKINYRRCVPDNPPFWTLLVDDLENTGSYDWTIQNYLEGWYEMQVVAVDKGGLTKSDATDTCFVINAPDPPAVTVVAPNGGEFWSGIQEIMWDSDDPDIEYGDTLAVSVEVSPDSGASWITLGSGLPDTGSLGWNTDQEQFPDGALYLVRVCVTDTFVGTQVCDISDNTFYVLNENMPPAVQVEYPNGGESLRNSAVIRWTATDPDTVVGDSLSITLSVSPDSGQSWYPPLVQGIPNTGSWVWNLGSFEDGNRYLIRACATDRQGITVCDISDETFSIFNDPDNPSVTILAPNGGERWSGVQTVEWEADDPDLFVGDTLSATCWVDSSPAAGFQGLSIANGIPGVPGRFEWDTGAFGLPDGDWYRLRLTVTDTDSLSATDESDDTFLLFNNNDAPSISIVSPDEGDILKGDELIQWDADDPDIQWGDTIAISLYFRGEETEQWIPIVLGLPDSGERLWDTRSVADGLTYQIRAVVRDTALAEGEAISGIFAIENINQPPDPFHLLEPENGATVTVLKPFLKWETATDIDAGDYTEYDVAYWRDDETPDTVFAGSDTSVTDQDWSEPLMDDNRYWWNVTATDSLGSAHTQSIETWWFVTNADGNDRPDVFHLVYPHDGALIHPDSVYLEWSESTDEDVLDLVTYTVYLDTMSDFSTSFYVPVDTLRTWHESGILADNTTYYWKILAGDRNGSSRWSEEIWEFTTDRSNDAPSAFSLISPSLGMILRATQMDTVRLRWESAPDPDPLDSVFYRVVFSDSIHPADPAWTEQMVELTAGSNPFIHLMTALSGIGERFEDNRIYTWHVVATDSRGDETLSEEHWWFATNDSNEAPLLFDLVSPCNGCTLSSLQPTLCWSPALDPDPLDVLDYRLEHDVDPDFPTLVREVDITQTCWSPRTPFQDRGSVYWRVFAIDRDGAETMSREEWEFIILPQSTIEGLINYPNPFAAGREETRIQYVLLSDSDVDIRIYDLLGNAVWHTTRQAGTMGGRRGTNIVPWTGHNSDGNIVGNGGYICLLKVTPPGESTVEAKRKIAVMK